MSKNKNKNKIKNFKLDSNQAKSQQIIDAQAKIAENEKQQKKVKDKKVKNTKKVNPNKKTIGTATKETFGELKKVNWPSFGKVAKTTGIVLAVVASFTLVLLGIDVGLQELHKLLIK